MSEVQSEAIETLGEFLAFLESMPGAPRQTRWYRGCSTPSHPLLPALFRHPTKQGNAEELILLEKDLLTWFKRRSVLYLARGLHDWEYLFYMQHYRVPTRLLDWTENPLIALYFALTRAVRKPARERSDAAVWVLEPDVWNGKALEDMGYPQEVPSAGDEALNAYVPLIPLEQMRESPVAMHAAHCMPRMVAQRGTFVMFGRDMRPMETIYSSGGFSRQALLKLVIPAPRVAGMLDWLIAFGITDSVVFPDLEGVSMEARRQFGFEV